MSKISHLLQLTAIVLHIWWTPVGANNVYEYISANSRLTRFKQLMDRHSAVQVFAKRQSLTVFAPTDTALQALETHNLRTDVWDKLAAHHIIPFLVTTASFPKTVRSLLPHVSPLYLTTKTLTNGSSKEFYVNNAHIVDGIALNTTTGRKQYLYIIDRALEPYISSTGYPPNALELISEPSIYDISQRWDDFYNKIIETKSEPVFEKSGQNHTFFVPITRFQSESLDRYSVLAHVIPRQTMFIEVMGDRTYRSAANNHSLTVDLSLTDRSIRTDEEKSLYIQSNAIKADAKHRKGVVTSRVLRANIPVKNGVIHLIDRPLVVIDLSINDYLRQESNGRLKTFNKLLDSLPAFRSQLNRLKEVTLLAPTDTAFNALNGDNRLNKILNNHDQLKALLELHVVPNESITTYDVRNKSQNVMSGNRQRMLNFSVVGNESNHLLIMDGEVNATSIETNIGTTNGIIHVIDRVLGIPLLTVADKLRADPSLSYSYSLGLNEPWSRRLARKDSRVTYFVPNDEAWDRLRKDLFKYDMNFIVKNVTNILNRHLIPDKEITFSKLNRSLYSINTVNDKLRLDSRGRDAIFVEWEDTRARIVRADIQALNGVIHVIDRVFIKNTEIEITINSSSHPFANIILTFVSLLILKYI